MWGELKRAPAWAFGLGLGGLLPFGAAAVAIAGAGRGTPPVLAEFALVALLLYGAVILSFLGGARWGRAIGVAPERPAPIDLAAAVLPAILGWAGALVAVPPAAAPALGLGMMIGGYVAVLAWDLSGVRTGDWPAWYAPLRTILSVGAVGALALGVAATL